MLKTAHNSQLASQNGPVNNVTTPLWDEFYLKSQNRKFKNKWDKIKAENR